MKRATVVIGAGFGDEGKGLMTDYFAAKHKNSVVVRFNGGAQAGHTVVDLREQGTDLEHERKTVFHHFGSGTWSGADTFLSEFFITNPMLWKQEHNLLNAPANKYDRSLYIHENALVTTPYDMGINQALESSKGCHTSCGVGIQETVLRSERGPRLVVSDLTDKGKLEEILKEIRNDYMPARMRTLGIEFSKTRLPHEVESKFDFYNREFLSQLFVDKCGEMIHRSVLSSNQILEGFEHVIFEGAQGLLLDEDHKFFPWVTRSKTGLRNALYIAEQGGIEELDVVYVTRSYMTRHGDGPFPSEKKDMHYRDDTNIKNNYQGTLRFGLLDAELIKEAILQDLEQAKGTINVRASIAITHLDQTKGQLMTVKAGEVPFTDIDQSSSRLFGVPISYCSFGPRRTDIVATTAKKKSLETV